MTPTPSLALSDAARHESLRRYLQFLAELFLDPDLRAKAGPSDFVQETFRAAHSARHRYRGTTDEEYRGWLRSILVNLIRNFRRRFRGTLARRVDREVAHRRGVDAASDDTPSRVVSREEQTRRLAEAVAALPERDRLVVALRFDEDLSFAEIGRRLGVTEDAARMRLSRALESLRGSLRGAAA